VERIEAFLEPGERLLWHGRPDANRLVRRQYGWCFLAGAFFGLSLIWSWASWQRGTGIGTFVGLLIAASGLAVVIAKAQEILNVRTTRYLVTSCRAAIVAGRTGRVVESCAAEEIGAVEVETFADGTGDVRFGREPRWRGYRGVTTDGAGFYGIADPERARQALQALAAGADVRMTAHTHSSTSSG
jgi:hypothetical protein